MLGAATTGGPLAGLSLGVEVPSKMGEPEGLTLLPVEHIEMDALPRMVLPPQR